MAQTGSRPEADVEGFRAAMGRFVTGVAVVTTEAGGTRYGMTINSLTSVSLDPLTLLVCLAKGSLTAEAVLARGRFLVNLLEASQERISRQFVAKIDDRFRDIALEPRADGLPAIAGTLGRMACLVETVQPVGDHLIVFGRVEECDCRDGAPLLYYRSGYRRLAEEAG
ncbi:MAG: flavin reductase family protein [Tistlia sp.]|uniref:flavin reductase family protein n=1 Tax=Tistlia sp. TaxID=3057121 RepID=UPI0034A22C32